MAKANGKRSQSIGQSKGSAATHTERATFVSFAAAPLGQSQQSPFETKWAAYQEWAVVERPDRQFAPILTNEALQVLREADHADGNP